MPPILGFFCFNKANLPGFKLKMAASIKEHKKLTNIATVTARINVNIQYLRQNICKKSYYINCRKDGKLVNNILFFRRTPYIKMPYC